MNVLDLVTTLVTTTGWSELLHGGGTGSGGDTINVLANLACKNEHLATPQVHRRIML